MIKLSREQRIFNKMMENYSNPNTTRLEQTYDYCSACIDNEIAIEEKCKINNKEKYYDYQKKAYADVYKNQEEEEMFIQYFGQCSKHKGHFDIDSFIAGIVFGFLSLLFLYWVIK